MTLIKQPLQMDELDCATSRRLLPEYVRVELANQAADELYPALAFHLQICIACERLYFALFHQQGSAKTVSELQSIGQRAVVAQILDRHLVSFWQRVAEKAKQLTIEIPILVGSLETRFGPLPESLVPQPVMSLATRSLALGQGEQQTIYELVTLPDSEADLAIVFGTGVVIDQKSTLTLQVKKLSSAQPIEQVRVILRDAEKTLLEMSSTDRDGLATFQALELKKYLVQVTYQNETWEVYVPLMAH